MPELIVELRAKAANGAKVRELVETIQGRMTYPPNALIPILAYMVDAFKVSLLDVLPIREWLGSDEDEAIDAQVMPAIQKTKYLWARDLKQVTPTAGV